MKILIPFLPLIYSALFFFSFPIWYLFALFLIGVMIGFAVIYADRLLHAFYLYPDTEFNQLLQTEWKRKNVFGVWNLLIQAEGHQEKLLTRSILFLAVYAVLTFFVLTSTGSMVGIGLMLGMGLRYTVDFWKLSRDPEVFHRQFLWQLKRSLSQQEVRGCVIGWTIAFSILSALVLI
jgi:hypothetical protein